MSNDKPRGYFKYILALDCETTGVAIRCDDPSYDPSTKTEYQAISWAFIVCDENLKEVDRLYVEVKYNGIAEWRTSAEKVHGLSQSYLAENGVSEEEAALVIGNFLMKFFGPDSSICPLGHNVMFDVWFLKRLMRQFGIELKFANRIIDTNSIGYTMLQTYNSDDLFVETGCPVREKHNAMEDIEFTLQAVKTMQTIFNIGLNSL